MAHVPGHNPNEMSFDQILAMLTEKYNGLTGGLMDGRGARGLDTPADREYQKYGTSDDTDAGLLDAVKNYKNTNSYTFDVDGNTEGYTFTGDDLNSDAIQRMRDMQGITAYGLEEPLNTIGNLGIGARGLNTPAEREKLAAIMGMSAHPDKMASFMDTGVLPDGYLQKYGVGARGLDTPAERDFLANTMNRDPVLMPGRTPTIPDNVPAGMHRMPDGSLMNDSDMNYGGTGEMSPNPTVVDRNLFNRQFAALTNEEKSRVEMMMSQMNDQQKADFAAGLTGAPLNGYAVQDERYDYMRQGGRF
jgi:hypothetical protein